VSVVDVSAIILWGIPWTILVLGRGLRFILHWNNPLLTDRKITYSKINLALEKLQRGNGD